MKLDQRKNAYLETRDLGQIAALILAGHRPKSLNQQGGILVGIFDATNEVRAALTQYVLDEIRVPPRAFLGLLRDLKGLAKSTAPLEADGRASITRSKYLVHYNQYKNVPGDENN